MSTRKRKGGMGSTARKNPMPVSYKTRFKYVEQTTINPAASGLATVLVFSANGLYDPNVSGTGHQPRGFDQLMALYDHYVVTNSAIKVTFCNPDGSLENVVCGINVIDGTVTNANPNDYLEQPYNTYCVIAPENGTSTIKTLNLKCNVGKFLGRRSVLSDPELKGSASANPTEDVMFHIWCAGLKSSDPASVEVLIELQYDAHLIEPVDVAQS